MNSKLLEKSLVLKTHIHNILLYFLIFNINILNVTF